MILTALALASMGSAFMQTILIPLQSELPTLFAATREETAWAITATLLAAAISTPISGRLGDMYGKRRVALTLLMLLIIGSAVAALSTSIWVLVTGRVLQGFAMGVTPLGISILRDTLPRRHLAAAIALVSGTLGVGAALGQPVSALITQNADWHYVFWASAAFGVLGFTLVAVFVPASTIRTGGRFDIAGALGLALGLSGILIGIAQGNTWGWGSPAILGLLGGGTAILLIWGWLELRMRQPLVDLTVSARGTVLMTNLASIGLAFGLFAAHVAYPQLLQAPAWTGGLGLEALPASLVQVASGLAMLAMTPIAGVLEPRIGAKPLLVAGAGIIAASYLFSILLPLQIWHIVVINILIGIGIGLGFAAMPSLIMQAVPLNETGAANGLNTLMRSLGTALAAAAAGTFLASTSIHIGNTSIPTHEGFRAIYLLGMTVAAIGTALAALIPRPKQ